MIGLRLPRGCALDRRGFIAPVRLVSCGPFRFVDAVHLQLEHGRIEQPLLALGGVAAVLRCSIWCMLIFIGA